MPELALPTFDDEALAAVARELAEARRSFEEMRRAPLRACSRHGFLTGNAARFASTRRNRSRCRAAAISVYVTRADARRCWRRVFRSCSGCARAPARGGRSHCRRRSSACAERPAATGYRRSRELLAQYVSRGPQGASCALSRALWPEVADGTAAATPGSAAVTPTHASGDREVRLSSCGTTERISSPARRSLQPCACPLAPPPASIRHGDRDAAHGVASPASVLPGNRRLRAGALSARPSTDAGLHRREGRRKS